MLHTVILGLKTVKLYLARALWLFCASSIFKWLVTLIVRTVFQAKGFIPSLLDLVWSLCKNSWCFTTSGLGQRFRLDSFSLWYLLDLGSFLTFAGEKWSRNHSWYVTLCLFLIEFNLIEYNKPTALSLQSWLLLVFWGVFSSWSKCYFREKKSLFDKDSFTIWGRTSTSSGPSSRMI